MKKPVKIALEVFAGLVAISCVAQIITGGNTSTQGNNIAAQTTTTPVETPLMQSSKNNNTVSLNRKQNKL